MLNCLRSSPSCPEIGDLCKHVQEEGVLGALNFIQAGGLSQRVSSGELAAASDFFAERIRATGGTSEQLIWRACHAGARIALGVVPGRSPSCRELETALNVSDSREFVNVFEWCLTTSQSIAPDCLTILKQSLQGKLTDSSNFSAKAELKAVAIEQGVAFALARGDYATTEVLFEAVEPFAAHCKGLRDKMTHLAQAFVYPNAGRGMSGKDGSLSALNDPMAVTSIDLMSSLRLLEFVTPRFPLSRSEEHGSFCPNASSAGDQQLKWVFDPWDGTEEGRKGLHGFYGIQAALVASGKNGIWQPTKNALIVLPNTPDLECVAWYNSELDRVVITVGGIECTVICARNVRHPVRVHVRKVTFDRFQEGHEGGSHLEAVANFAQLLGNELSKSRTGLVVPGGANSHAAIQLLLGKVDVVVWIPARLPKPQGGDGSKDHDVAPVQSLIEAAGGWACDLNGDPIVYEGTSPAALNGFVASISLPRGAVIRLTRDLLKKLRETAGTA